MASTRSAILLYKSWRLYWKMKMKMETTDRRDFGGKPLMWRWGRVLSWKIPKFCCVGSSKKQHFCVFRVPFDCPAQPTGNNFTPNQWYRWKAETLKVCFLIVWRVCDQAFGRYRPWTVPKRGHVTITKITILHTITRRKIQWFQKCYSFRSVTKNNEVNAEKPFQNSVVISERLWTLGRLELRSSSSIYPFTGRIAAKRQTAGIVFNQSPKISIKTYKHHWFRHGQRRLLTLRWRRRRTFWT